MRSIVRQFQGQQLHLRRNKKTIYRNSIFLVHDVKDSTGPSVCTIQLKRVNNTHWDVTFF